MKNVKLTLATTLSVLALTFAGAASADNSRSNNFKQKNEVSYNKKVSNNKVSKNVTKSSTKNVYNSNKNVKKIVVKSPVIKKSPAKKVVITKKSVKSTPKTQHVSSHRVNTKIVSKKVIKPFSYKVRSGDTLYRISLKTGVSVNQIVKLNRFSQRNINNIRIGQVLRIS